MRRPTSFLLTALLAVIAASGAGCSCGRRRPPAEKQSHRAVVTERFVDLASDGRLTIRSTDGPIRVRGADVAQARVGKTIQAGRLSASCPLGATWAEGPRRRGRRLTTRRRRVARGWGAWYRVTRVARLRAPDAMGPTVSVHGCATYAESRAAIERALASSGLGDRLRGKRVLLKPNLMKGAAPERCTNTHPDFVGALTGALVAAGSEVLVGDSSGLLGFTDEVFEASGVAAAVRAAGGTVVNLDAGPFATVPVTGMIRRSFVLPRVLFEVDAVVQVPKLKAHSLTVISAAMKNLVGVMPGATKCALHVTAPAPRDFAHGIIDLFLALDAGGAHLEGAVVDAVWALAGRDGRDQPVVRRPGLVVAGGDLTAVDVACARVLGLDPGSVPTIRAAAQRRVGPATLDGAVLQGDPLPRCAEPAPGCPPGLKERSLLAARAHYWMRGRIVLPEHDPSRCTGQHRCVEVCPVDAIRFEGRRAVISEKCIDCYACHEQCPTGAMRLRTPWPLRGVLRQRAEGLDVSKVAGGSGA